MTGHGAKFGRKQEGAIAALLSSRTIEEAARACHVGYKTLLRWLEIPEFQKRYREARRKAVQQAIARLQQSTSAATIVILRLMTDANVPAAVKLRAAESVIDHAIKSVELEDIEARLTALERGAATNANRT